MNIKQLSPFSQVLLDALFDFQKAQLTFHTFFDQSNLCTLLTWAVFDAFLLWQRFEFLILIQGLLMDPVYFAAYLQRSFMFVIDKDIHSCGMSLELLEP